VQAKDGYQNPQWWESMPPEYKKSALAEQKNRIRNAPRDNVTWYQSVAFSRWLNAHLEGLELPDLGFSDSKGDSGSKFILGQNAEVRLPLEWEWQWAAQGGNAKRSYPWGEWKEGYSNTKEAKQWQTVAVGMYPQGRAECGAQDMAGNVWEWCANRYSKLAEIRVLLGRSFWGVSSNSMCAFRDGLSFPFNAAVNFGFRLVIAPPICSSDL
jgi:formylglycine-generating enzyme required for sulfatase activity